MRILIFGATGVLGRATVPHLTGHLIGGTTRSPDKLAGLSAMGVEGAVCDAYDAGAVAQIARAFRPDVVVRASPSGRVTRQRRSRRWSRMR